jgi:hypothetical protein
VNEDKKHDSGSDETFLSTTARALGSTLGKLAAKTGLVHPAEKPTVPPSAARKKAAAKSAAKRVRKPVARKKVAPKKVVRKTTKAKR